jgi:hypothetical protein
MQLFTAEFLKISFEKVKGFSKCFKSSAQSAIKKAAKDF